MSKIINEHRKLTKKTWTRIISYEAGLDFEY